MDYGKVFKKEREKLDLSQREMAKRLGVTPAALWKIESGRTTPKQETIMKLCSVAVIPLAYFYQRALTLDDFKFPVESITDGTSTVSLIY